MYRAVTRAIQVTVSPNYRPERSDSLAGKHFWAYTVEIRNLGRERVQLLMRYWRITDGAGRVQEVRGPGVVGEQPVLNPGQAFEYTSGCPLDSNTGVMEGHYVMVSAGGESFTVAIPAFSLDIPHTRRVVN